MRGHAFVSVVGVSFEDRQNLLGGLLAATGDGASLSARLVREPRNPFDANAISVLVSASFGLQVGTWDRGLSRSGHEWPRTFRHVGFIPRPLAAKWAPKMDRGQQIEVTEVRVSESSRGTYGCKIAVHIHEERHDQEDADPARGSTPGEVVQ